MTRRTHLPTNYRQILDKLLNNKTVSFLVYYIIVMDDLVLVVVTVAVHRLLATVSFRVEMNSRELNDGRQNEGKADRHEVIEGRRVRYFR